jgi:aminoglycoside phosphotransferase (APT) family kinase protein
MNLQHLFALSLLCGLGQPVTIPSKTEGGATHATWQLTTPLGGYALKKLNPKRMEHPAKRSAYAASEQMSRLLLQYGIPTVPGIFRSGSALQPLADSYYALYPWVEGTVLGTQASDVHYAYKVGKLLAQMHAVTYDRTSYSLPSWAHQQHTTAGCQTFRPPTSVYARSGTDDMSLEECVAVLRKHGLGQVADDVEQYSGVIYAIYHLGNQGLDALAEGPFVFSHRDLHQGNVIWRDGKPIVIDWEMQGVVHPSEDAIFTAYLWAGGIAGKPQMETFEAFLAGYSDAGGRLRAWEPALHLAASGFVSLIARSIKEICSLLEADKKSGEWVTRRLYEEITILKVTIDHYEPVQKSIAKIVSGTSNFLQASKLRGSC